MKSYGSLGLAAAACTITISLWSGPAHALRSVGAMTGAVHNPSIAFVEPYETRGDGLMYISSAQDCWTENWDGVTWSNSLCVPSNHANDWEIPLIIDNPGNNQNISVQVSVYNQTAGDVLCLVTAMNLDDGYLYTPPQGVYPNQGYGTIYFGASLPAGTNYMNVICEARSVGDVIHGVAY